MADRDVHYRILNDLESFFDTADINAMQLRHLSRRINSINTVTHSHYNSGQRSGANACLNKHQGALIS